MPTVDPSCFRGLSREEQGINYFLALLGMGGASPGSQIIIPPNRMVDWSFAGVEGGIPDSQNISATLGTPGQSLGFVQSVTAAQINSAIAAAPSGGVVELEYGTYNLTAGVDLYRSDVVLRGLGPTVINMVFGPGVGGARGYIDCSGSAVFSPPIITAWNDGYAKDSSILTVDSTAGYSVNDLAGVDQLNDTNYVWGGTSGSSNLGNDPAGGHLQFQLTKITGINSATSVSIDPPIYMRNWSAGFSPRMFQSVTAAGVIKNVGIENIHVEGTGTCPHNISFNYAENCWVKDVDLNNGNSTLLSLYICKNFEARHSKFRANYTVGVGSYSVLAIYCSRLLIEDNIFNGEDSGVGAPILQTGTSGSVVAYNYVRHASGVNWTGYISGNHNTHPHFNLFEGNYAPQIYSDYVHGSSSDMTFFRNRLEGQDEYDVPPVPSTSNTHAITLEYLQRYYNVVGNVLGKVGYHTNYERSGSPVADWMEDAIYKLGYEGTYTDVSDPLVLSTLLRHGNYDTVNGAILWDPAIANHTLPASLRYTSKPSWWPSELLVPWPPINPSSPGTATNPAKYRYDNP